MTLESMRFWQLGISFMLSWKASMMPSIFCFVWDTFLQSGGRKRYWMEMVRLVYDGKEFGAFISLSMFGYRNLEFLCQEFSRKQQRKQQYS